MKRIIRLSRLTAQVSKWLSATCLFILVLVVIADVTLRSFNISALAGASEIANYLQIWLVYLGLAFAYYDGSFIRMDLLLKRFHGKAERIRSVAVKTVSLITVCIILWFSTEKMLNSYTHDIVSIGVLRVELYLPQTVLCLGLLFFVFQMILDLMIEIFARSSDPSQTNAESAF